jgi:hypothetical protein
MDRAEEPSS